MILNRVAVLDDQGRCYIGLKPLASIVLVMYDVSISCWLTVLFIRPIMSTHAALHGPSKSRLLQVARRTLIGSVIALFLSTANILSLVYFRGYEESVLCLLSCTLDVTLNACSIHWVTSRGKGPTYSSWRNNFSSSSSSSQVISSSEKRTLTDTQHSVTVRPFSD
ncbi:hypothetical protein BGZ76_005966 [Entomortierella beljakovae]|nr:hypothetical protein BGZ76_005966 [Entomortierella beljakovae]